MRGDGGEYDGAVTMGLNSNNSPLVRASHDGALRNEVLSDTVQEDEIIAQSARKDKDLRKTQEYIDTGCISQDEDNLQQEKHLLEQEDEIVVMESAKKKEKSESGHH